MSHFRGAPQLPGRIRVRQHRAIDMDDHLVPLSGGAGIYSRVEGCLREQGEGVRLLLGQRGHFRGNVGRGLGCTPKVRH